MNPGTVSLADIKFVPVDVFPAIRRYQIFKDDIFISVAGTLGIVGKVPPELDGANLTENADRITNITCSQDYLLHVLMSPLIQNTVDAIRTVGAQPKLALTRIRKFVIPLPPSKAEQEAIAGALSDADSHIESLEQLITKKRHIKQGAMQELLTGKRRLPGFDSEWEEMALGQMGKCHRGVSYNPSDDLSPYDTESTTRLLRSNNVGREAGECRLRKLGREGDEHLAIGPLGRGGGAATAMPGRHRHPGTFLVSGLATWAG